MSCELVLKRIQRLQTHGGDGLLDGRTEVRWETINSNRLTMQL